MSWNLDVTGVNNLVAELASEEIESRMKARHAIQVYSARIQATAKTFVPRDTGTLSRSITRTSKLSPGGAEGEIGATARYGGFVEFGTSDTAPQAFMGPALDRHSQNFVNEIARIPFGYKNYAPGSITGAGELDLFG